MPMTAACRWKAPRVQRISLFFAEQRGRRPLARGVRLREQQGVRPYRTVLGVARKRRPEARSLVFSCSHLQRERLGAYCESRRMGANEPDAFSREQGSYGEIAVASVRFRPGWRQVVSVSNRHHHDLATRGVRVTRVGEKSLRVCVSQH